ncbi:glycerophosphodiester phosphodiesterase [uncultured Hymenobacter sp.]|uniref:glycerophosphodiester phosphodiesterase n=1 Tax=uncultured Hymenobacter sp. TaxID=170016 RepID=UPI0035CA180D
MKRRFLLLALAGGVGLAAALAGCADPAPKLPNLLILGHAGSGFFTPISPFNYRPPSSWLGIENALNRGADGVEIDLQLSQDSIPVLYHDPKLENMSTGQGCVSQLPAAALTGLRYRGGPPYDWLQHEQPITFDTLLARLSRRPRFPRLHLDLHEYDLCQPAGHALDRSPALLRQLARRLARYHVPPQNVLLITTNRSTVQYARVALPQVPVGLEITTDDFAGGLRTAQAENVGTLVLSSKRVTPAQTAQAHAAGLRVVVFGGRSAGSIKRILASQPDEIEVDNVAKLLDMQGRR